MDDTIAQINDVIADLPTGTFSSLGFALALYLVTFVVAMTMFEVAVHFDMNRLFAPRSYARPKQVSASY